MPGAPPAMPAEAEPMVIRKQQTIRIQAAAAAAMAAPEGRAVIPGVPISPAADRPGAVLSSSSPKTGSPAAERSTSAETMPTVRYRMMGQAEQAQEVRSLSIMRMAIPATL